MDAGVIDTSQTITQVRPATTRGFADLDSEDFFGLLIAELQNQDPLKPTDNQQLLSQMSSIRQMEQSTTLNKALTALAGEQRFGATAGLIGHFVAGTVTDSGGNAIEVSGVVTGVQFNRNGEAILELHNGGSLPASKVDLVTLVDNLPPDVLDQIRAEREATSGTSTDPAETPASGAGDTSAAAKQRPPLAGDWLRNLGKQTEATASILDQLFAPGAAIGI
ncbi:MAG TPA: flagellar hook capping FlgD N-terminal domain-containing protein [Phycisphaerae bacterium]|nr:flagellar hook capping FlgD N-terminal domain-containing protein [Phycisphaerae bacterium]